MTPRELAKSGSEHGEQRALFAWAAMAYRWGIEAANDPASYTSQGQAKLNAKWTLEHIGVPQLKWLHAIHNQGHGDAVRGGRAKAEGVKAGVFDLFLPVPILFQPPRNPDSGWASAPRSISYAGLYIEMKKLKGGRPSELQETFQIDMRDMGYKAEFRAGWRNARDEIISYLGLTA